MKKNLLTSVYRVTLFLAILLFSGNAFATHIAGADLFYTWDSGSVYTITLVVYGNCASATSADLPTATPQICIYKEGTYVTSITLAIQAPSAGIEVTPVCAPDSLH